MKKTPIKELQTKINILIDLEIEQAMKNKEYEKIKISDLPQIQKISADLQKSIVEEIKNFV